MQSSEEIIKIFEGLEQFYKDKDKWNKKNAETEEKFQILVHSLQNNKFPKSSRKFVEELRKVRHERWLISRICLMQNQDIKCALGHLRTIGAPKVRQTIIKTPEMEEYCKFVKSL